MIPMISPLVRVSLTVALVGLLVLSIVQIKNVVTTTWNQVQHEEARYRQAPGCFPHQDASEVDTTLPPCQDVTLVVAAKSLVPMRRQDGKYRQITLRDASGRTQTAGDIYEDLWNSLRVGDPVTATFWEGRLQEVAANGYRNPIFDETRMGHAKTLLGVWIVTAFICVCPLSLLWGPKRRTILSPCSLYPPAS